MTVSIPDDSFGLAGNLKTREDNGQESSLVSIFNIHNLQLSREQGESEFNTFGRLHLVAHYSNRL